MGQVVERKINTYETLKKDTATGYDGLLFAVRRRIFMTLVII